MGPMIGGLLTNPHLVSWFNLNTPFLFSAGLACLNLIFLWFVFEETFEPSDATSKKWYQGFIDLKLAFVSRQFMQLSVLFFCIQLSWGIYFQGIPMVLVHHFHFDASAIGFFMTYIALCFVVILMVIMRIMLRLFAVRTIVIIGLPLMLIGSGLSVFWHSMLGLYATVMPVTLGVGLTYNTVMSLFSDAADEQTQGQAMGLSVAIMSLAWMVAAALIGALSSVNLFIPYAIMIVAAMVALLVISRYRV